jgi:hypothetical protein
MVPLLDFLTKHFLVLSTVITSLLTALTFIFIVSYVSVFDVSIIWIIEYTDILKFVFISLGIASGLVTLLFSLSKMSIQSLTNKRAMIVFSAYVIGLLVFFALDIWFHRQIEGRWFYSIMTFIAYILVILSIFSIRDFIIKFPDFNKWDTFATVAMFISAISTCGTTYGLSVKFSGPNHNDVWVKDAQTLHDATIIMILSHHSIFQVDQKIITIPSANVLRIVYITQ